MGFTAKRIDEMEAAYGGSYVRVRASLGAAAFGIQVIQLPPDSGELYPLHDHSLDGQEEIYALLDGGGAMEVDGERFELEPDMFVRVDAASRRRFRSGPQGARLLAMGGVPGAVYEPPANSELGGPETFNPGAESSMLAQ
jgi:mannose-6-phosphate isomerase-like protein (cupin superfamily)